MDKSKCYRPKALYPNHKDRVDIKSTKGTVCICMDCEEQIYGAEISFDELTNVIDSIAILRKKQTTNRKNG